MAFRTTPAPYVRAKRSTEQIMLILASALGLVFIAAVILNFVKLGSSYGIKTIIMMIVSLATTAICDVITSICRFDKNGKVTLKEKILNDLRYNYSYITAIIFTLSLPVWTSYYVLIIGNVFATVVVKNLFGGFGKNIFNPAVMARLFVGVCFTSVLSSNASIPGLVTTDVVTGATVTNAMKLGYGWLTDSAFLGEVTTFDLLTGNYIGSMGETFTILILLIGVVLSILKVINWRTPTFFIGTVAITSLFIGIFTKMANPFMYALYSVALGGLVYGAVFMLTDPVTGPTSNFGKALFGVIAGFITVLIRIKTNNCEGVGLSIAFCNLIAPAIDSLVVSKTNKKLPLKYGIVFGMVALSIVLNSLIASKLNVNNEISLAKYGFELQEGHSLVTSNVRGEAYQVVDESGKEIAAVYYVGGEKETVIDTGDPDLGAVNITIKMFVAVNIEDGSFYDIAYVTSPALDGGMGYEEYIKNDLEAYDYVGDYDVMAGATYATTDIKELMQEITIKFEQTYGKKGGNIK